MLHVHAIAPHTRSPFVFPPLSRLYVVCLGRWTWARERALERPLVRTPEVRGRQQLAAGERESTDQPPRREPPHGEQMHIGEPRMYACLEARSIAITARNSSYKMSLSHTSSTPGNSQALSLNFPRPAARDCSEMVQGAFQIFDEVLISKWKIRKDTKIQI